jgi:hypothetical protein
MAKGTPAGRDGGQSADRSTRPRHIAFAVSLYDRHSVALVTLADPRSDGRARRLLAGFRFPVGTHDLVGLTPVDASLIVAQALAEALSAESSTIARPQAPAPPGGSRGRPVVMRGQELLPLG